MPHQLGARRALTERLLQAVQPALPVHLVAGPPVGAVPHARQPTLPRPTPGGHAGDTMSRQPGLGEDRTGGPLLEELVYIFH